MHYVAYFRYTCSDMFTCQKNLREDEWGHVLFPLHYLMYRKVIKVYCVAVVPNCVLKLNFGFVFALSVWHWSCYFLNELEPRNRSLLAKSRSHVSIRFGVNNLFLCVRDSLNFTMVWRLLCSLESTCMKILAKQMGTSKKVWTILHLAIFQL